MTVFALKLLLAHLIGDFLLQPDHWVERKRKRKLRSVSLYKHLGVHLLALLILLQFKLAYWPVILIILITHFAIDLVKIKLEGLFHNAWLFALDQCAHLLVIGVVVYLYYPFTIETGSLVSPTTLLFMLAILMVTSVSAILIRLLMNRWVLSEDKEEDSLPQAGKYIGMLERLLVFAFIVFQQWPAIGWLIAAKSILRFSDLSRAKDRKLTEYVLIGTFLSFGLALLIGLAYLFFVGHIDS